MVLEDAKKKWNQQIFQPQIITRSSLSFETAPPNKHASCIGPKNEQNYYYIAVSVWLSIARAMGLPWLVCGFDSFPVENLASSHWRWSFQGWTSPILFETTNQLVLSTNKTLSTFQNQWPSDTSTNGMSRVFPKLRHIQIIQIILLVIYNHRKNSIIQCFPMKHITFLSPFYPHHVPIEISMSWNVKTMESIRKTRTAQLAPKIPSLWCLWQAGLLQEPWGSLRGWPAGHDLLYRMRKPWFWTKNIGKG